MENQQRFRSFSLTPVGSREVNSARHPTLQRAASPLAHSGSGNDAAPGSKPHYGSKISSLSAKFSGETSAPVLQPSRGTVKPIGRASCSPARDINSVSRSSNVMKIADTLKDKLHPNANVPGGNNGLRSSQSVAHKDTPLAGSSSPHLPRSTQVEVTPSPYRRHSEQAAVVGQHKLSTPKQSPKPESVQRELSPSPGHRQGHYGGLDKSPHHDIANNAKSVEENSSNRLKSPPKVNMVHAKSLDHDQYGPPMMRAVELRRDSNPSSKESSPAPLATLPPQVPQSGETPPASRFSNKKRRAKRNKRGRSDGFVLGLDIASSDDEGHNDPYSISTAIGRSKRSGSVDPESFNWIFWLRNPTVQNLAQLRKSIRCNDTDWMKEFLEFDGLGLLFQCLKQLSSYQSTHLTDMVLRMSCVACIREVVNSRSGLDNLLTMGDKSDNLFGRRFSSAMETNNVMVKMQIFELLSAICVYSTNGFYLTLDALERYKLWRKERFRFSLLVNELTTSEQSSYKTTVMALINSIVVASESLRDRVRIRSEFVALNILDVVGCLRHQEDADLKVQLDVFEDELVADTDATREAALESTSIDLGSHSDLFNTIYNKVQDTSLGLSFLSILYNLYQIDPNSPNSESTWILVERLTQKAVEGSIEADRLMEEARSQRRVADVAVQTQESVPPGDSTPLRQRSQAAPYTSPTDGTSSAAPPPPPPPPPPPLPGSAGGCPPPPPPPPPPGHGGPPPPPPPPTSPGGPPPPPPPPPPGLSSSASSLRPQPGTELSSPVPSVVPIVTPDPSCKMRHFTWNKVPALQVDKTSIWGEVNKMDDSIPVQYDLLKEMFAQKSVQQEVKHEETSFKLKPSSSEISLLDPKRSMNVNIFLKQFRKNNAAIVDMVRKGESRNIGVEKLKGLIKILPQQDEVELIQSFDGNSDMLGNAEKFFLKLVSVPCYRLRLDLMVLKSDFQSQLSNVRSNLEVLTGLCRCLYDNKSLKKFLRLVLHAGNYINKGSNAGEAVGFRINSLNKLALTKSNDPSISLLHVLVEVAEVKDKASLDFVDDLLDDLHKASRFSVEQVRTEFKQLKTSVKKLQNQMNTTREQEIKDQFGDFLEEADGDLLDVEETLERLQSQTERLAQHYCENKNSFDLEEFIGAFREFCDRVKACQQEIQSKKAKAEKAELRKKAHEEMLEKRKFNTSVKDASSPPPGSFKLPGMMGPPAGSPDAKIVDNIVNEIRRGNVLRRLSVRRKMGPAADS